MWVCNACTDPTSNFSLRSMGKPNKAWDKKYGHYCMFQKKLVNGKLPPINNKITYKKKRRQRRSKKSRPGVVFACVQIGMHYLLAGAGYFGLANWGMNIGNRVVVTDQHEALDTVFNFKPHFTICFNL